MKSRIRRYYTFEGTVMFGTKVPSQDLPVLSDMQTLTFRGHFSGIRFQIKIRVLYNFYEVRRFFHRCIKVIWNMWFYVHGADNTSIWRKMEGIIIEASC